MSATPSTTAETSSTFIVRIAVSGILFDMDGVLTQSTAGDERCWIRWAARHQITGGFDVQRTHGRRAADTIRDHLPHVTETELADHLLQLDALAVEEQCRVEAYPGARELLQMLPPYRWTVVTSASEAMMRSRLGAAGLPVPSSAVGGDSVSRGKPDPEGYRRGAALLTRPPGECLVIEDAPVGVRAGKSAGCQVLAIASTHRAEALREADWIVASLDQISVAIDPETATVNLHFPAIARA